MHISGKILTWFALLCACAAAVLMSKLVVTRNSWTKSVEKLTDQNIENARLIADRKRKLQDLQGELARLNLGWDRYYPPAQAALLDPTQGTISVQHGTTSGLGVPDRPSKPVVHVFPLANDGTSTYLAPFQVETLQENQSALRATVPLRAMDAGKFQNLGLVRLRERIPVAFLTRFSDFQVDFQRADMLLASTQRSLGVQKKLVDVSKEHLDLRLGELDPKLRRMAAPGPMGLDDPRFPEYSQGLIKAIADAEEERNLALAEVDHLRRELKKANERLRQLVGSNRALVKQLPQPASSTAPAATAANVTNK